MQLLFVLLSVFGGGLFLVPLLLVLGAGVFYYYGRKAQKSGWTRTNKYGTTSGSDPLPWYEIGQLVFAAVCAAFAIITFFAILAAQ